mmetsp:Transcript_99737/g.250039  ORF Transcript_99737/g.250039 Transcript_99737/m.250039 type:complete len:353 (+) Transcript_99737:164-1222(+)
MRRPSTRKYRALRLTSLATLFVVFDQAPHRKFPAFADQTTVPAVGARAVAAAEVRAAEAEAAPCSGAVRMKETNSVGATEPVHRQSISAIAASTPATPPSTCCKPSAFTCPRRSPPLSRRQTSFMTRSSVQTASAIIAATKSEYLISPLPVSSNSASALQTASRTSRGKAPPNACFKSDMLMVPVPVVSRCKNASLAMSQGEAPGDATLEEDAQSTSDHATSRQQLRRKGPARAKAMREEVANGGKPAAEELLAPPHCSRSAGGSIDTSPASHGWCSASSAVRRSSGLGSINANTKLRPTSETSDHSPPSKEKLAFLMSRNSCFSEVLLKGIFPDKRMYVMTPMLHMSHCEV